jgi:hypothetical protein
MIYGRCDIDDGSTGNDCDGAIDNDGGSIDNDDGSIIVVMTNNSYS